MNYLIHLEDWVLKRGNNMEEIRCIGCGSVLQSEDKSIAGFVPKTKLDEASGEVVCRRCFRLKNYNEVTPLHIDADHYREIISEIGSEDALVVKIIDIFDIEGSIIPQIAKLTNHNDMILLANKTDLLPKSVKEGKLKHHLIKIVADHNLKPKEIVLMSAKKNKNLDETMSVISEYAGDRNIYIVGATNVGKSTFVNALLKAYAGTKHDVITVSSSAGTTLDLIQIPFGKQFIIDTPGIINDNQLTHYIGEKTLKAVTPKKEIKPKGFQLNSDQTLFVGGLARIDYTYGTKASFVCYFSEFLEVHRTKLENADNLYETNLYKVLTPPYEGEEQLTLKPHTFKINRANKVDIVLPGLGFVTYKGIGTIIVHTPEHIIPYVREALI